MVFTTNAHGVTAVSATGARRANGRNIFPTSAHRVEKSSATSVKKAANSFQRISNSHAREGIEIILRRSRFLPAGDRQLIRAFYLHGEKLAALSLKLKATGGQVRRRLRAIRRRLADPIFLLTVQFAFRLPEPLAEIARLHFRAGATIIGCAAQLEMSPHNVRHALKVARTMLVIAGVNKYGGTDTKKRTLIAALLGHGQENFQPTRLRRSEASA